MIEFDFCFLLERRTMNKLKKKPSELKIDVTRNPGKNYYYVDKLIFIGELNFYSILFVILFETGNSPRTINFTNGAPTLIPIKPLEISVKRSEETRSDPIYPNIYRF